MRSSLLSLTELLFEGCKAKNTPPPPKKGSKYRSNTGIYVEKAENSLYLPPAHLTNGLTVLPLFATFLCSQVSFRFKCSHTSGSCSCYRLTIYIILHVTTGKYTGN